MSAPQYIGSGLWGILATPFNASDFSVDEKSLRREVALFKNLGATGVVALGVFGEGAALNSQEQKSVVEIVCHEASDMPVIVGISERTTATAIEQAERATSAAGANLAGLMVQAHSANPQILSDHFAAIHEATGAGIILQDYPVASGVKISVTQVLQTLAQCPFIVAIKSESPPTAQVIASLTSKTNIPVFGGLGGVGLLDELAAGAAGAMTGFSYPEGLLEALRAFTAGGFESAREVFSKWLPLANFEAQPGIALALRKEILKQRGIFTDGAVRPPAPTMPEELRAIMTAHLEIAETILHSLNK